MMNQQDNDTQVDVFRTILDLESRGQQIEEIVQRIKHAFLMAPGQVSLPDAVGVLDELHWSAKHLDDGVQKLERHVGIRRRPVARHGHGAAAPKPNHALRGSTRSIPMPDLIALLSAQRKTGTLYIKAGDERFVLELLEGAVVHVVSDSPGRTQRLGDILVAQHKISTGQLEEFLSRYCRKDGRLGEALAKTRVVSEEDLRDALEYQVRELFRRVFSVDEALFSFTSGKVSDLQHRVSLNTTQLLLETARRQDEDLRDATDTALGNILGDIANSPDDEPAEADAPRGDHAPAAEPSGAEPSGAEPSGAQPSGAQPSEEEPTQLHPQPAADDEPSSELSEATDRGHADLDVEAPAGDVDGAVVADQIEADTEAGATATADPSDNDDEDDEENSCGTDDGAALGELPIAPDATDADPSPSEDGPSGAAPSDEDAGPDGSEESAATAASTATSTATTELTAAEKAACVTALHAVRGITRRTAKQLIARNIQSLEDLKRASDRDLLSVPGIGHRTLRLIHDHCDRHC